MVKEIEVHGFDELMKTTEAEEGNKVCVLFTGTLDDNGQSWCPDCVKGMLHYTHDYIYSASPERPLRSSELSLALVIRTHLNFAVITGNLRVNWPKLLGPFQNSFTTFFRCVLLYVFGM